LNERVLTARELNRALLARQLLLDRSDLPLTRALERVGGLQTQYAPSAYIGLWSRLTDFRRETLTQALERRRVVQATLLRSTIHMVTRRDFHLFAEAVRGSRLDWWLRIHRAQLQGIDLNRVARRVRHHMAGGPLRAAELQTRLEADGFPPVVASGAGMWVDLVRVPPSGTWERRRADLYGLADQWVGPSEATEEKGLEHVVRRYLVGFGPAPADDVASWAGLRVTKVRPVMERLRLRRFRDEEGRQLHDLPGGELPDADTPAPIRFLPVWDATLLVHARRTQILPEHLRPSIFDNKTPHSFPTFLVDGAVSGTWRYEKGHVRLDPFDRVSSQTRRELEDEAERLAAFHAEGE
jgi:hypothetical protein